LCHSLFAVGGSRIAGDLGMLILGLNLFFGPLCCRTGTELSLRPCGIAAASLKMLLAYGIL